MSRATELGILLNHYQSENAVFPASLEALVDSGLISVSRFDDLQFQKAPGAERSAWTYVHPESIEEIAIISPDPVVPWSGSAGLFITARANGGGEMIGAGKRFRIQYLLKPDPKIQPIPEPTKTSALNPKKYRL